MNKPLPLDGGVCVSGELNHDASEPWSPALLRIPSRTGNLPGGGGRDPAGTKPLGSLTI